MINATLLENSYYKWLKKDLIFKDVENGYVSISTPFIDPSFDNINLYVHGIGQNKIEVSDFGFTISNLEDAGINLDKRSRVVYRIFKQALDDFGIKREDEALLIRTSKDRFPIAKNRLLQGIMRINDIIYLSKGNVKVAFNDIVDNFLLKESVLYTHNIEIASENGISSHFDFLIPEKNGVEKLIKTSARPNDPNYAKAFNFDVKATKLNRPNATFIYLFNDYTHNTNINPRIVNTAMSGLNDDEVKVVGYDEIRRNNTLLVN
ncbi:DUF1828 domain-containing protein [Limosilactobacillus sp.]|uniref:DUF1828 domain-containing protein n=1 Tax=Limosilactobacillus sp. TaxID=2773925 RepID=UPI00345E2935